MHAALSVNFMIEAAVVFSFTAMPFPFTDIKKAAGLCPAIKLFKVQSVTTADSNAANKPAPATAAAAPIAAVPAISLSPLPFD